jgi:hypothetical protein
MRGTEYPSKVNFLNINGAVLFLDPIRFSKLKFPPFLVGICMGGNLNISNFKILSMCVCSWPQFYSQTCHQINSTVKFVQQNFHLLILSRNFFERYP